jgi:hypothetical protein
MTTTQTDDMLDRQAREIQNVVDQCRRAMTDLTVEEKAVAVDQLRGWVELERSTHEPMN